MKMDHPPLMKEKEMHDDFMHNIHHVEKHYGGDGHKAAHEHYGKHKEAHKMHHEHVKAMCYGGKA